MKDENRYRASYELRRPYGTEFYAPVVIDTTIARPYGRDGNRAFTGEAKYHTEEKAIKAAEAKIAELNKETK